ncbi:hypothetical protein GCM10027446_16410 [Angustibacter peucedani]
MALTVGAAGVVGVAAASPAQAMSSAYTGTYESNVVRSINYQRALHHLRPLSYRYCPDRYAESLASKLRYSSSIYHQSLGPIMNGCGATRASENIVRAGTHTSSTAIVQLWMNSSGHRANILDSRVTQIGVATTCSSRYCTTVADFIRP